jgi:hypothetical protein
MFNAENIEIQQENSVTEKLLGKTNTLKVRETSHSLKNIFFSLSTVCLSIILL